MLRVAITGNIAAGKSLAENILKSQGYKVLDADVVSHELLTVKNEPLYQAFKDYNVFDEGEFSRKKVAELVFSDSNMLKKLTSIIHPLIKQEILKFFEINKNEKAVFVGIPLLFESSMQDVFDKIILIYADDNIRMQRILERNDYTQEHAKKRMDSQQSQDEKIALSDFVIYNNGSADEFSSKLNELISLLRL